MIKLDKNAVYALQPFNMHSVLMYHRLKNDGYHVACFFDQNVVLHTRCYDTAYIQQAHYNPQYTVIICHRAETTEIREIRERLLSIGYHKADILDSDEEIQTETSIYQAAAMADLQGFAAVKPYLFESSYNHDLAELKKLRRLNELGAPDGGLVYVPFDKYEHQELYRDSEGKEHILLYRCEFDITNRCSLKCKNCANLMQYFEHPEDIPQSQVVSDYKKLLSLVDWIDNFLILGGEPLMHPDLPKIIKEILDDPLTDQRVGQVRLLTNGTIPLPDKLIDVLKGSNVCLWISNYGEKSRKLGQIINQCIDNGIYYRILPITTWKDICQFAPRDEPFSDSELLSLRRSCATYCRSVSSGKMFLCAFINGAHHLQMVPPDSRNYVDLCAENAKEQMVNYLDKSTPMPPACSWCSGNSLEQWSKAHDVPAAIQVPSALPYRKFVAE